MHCDCHAAVLPAEPAVVGDELAMVVNPALAPCADGGDSQHAVEDHLAPVLEERLVVRGIVARALDLSATIPLASDLLRRMQPI